MWKRRAEELADKIPGSKLQILPGTGHMVHHAEPEVVARAVEAIASRPTNASASSNANCRFQAAALAAE